MITHPNQARQFLSQHPQVAYAVFFGLITSNIIPADVLTRMLEATPGGGRPVPPPHLQQHQPPPPQNFGPPPQLHPQHPQHPPYPQPPSRLQQPQPMQGMIPPPMGVPPLGAMFGHPMQPTPPGMQPAPPGMQSMPPYYRPGPQGPPPPPPQQPQSPAQLTQQATLLPLLSALKNGGGDNADAQVCETINAGLECFTQCAAGTLFDRFEFDADSNQRASCRLSSHNRIIGTPSSFPVRRIAIDITM